MKKNQKILNGTMRFFAICSCFILASCRHHNHHHKSECNQKSECFYRYPATDYYQSFSEWINMKNSTSYSPFLPHTELFEMEACDFHNGEPISSRISTCSSRKTKHINPEMPLHEKSLCPFEYVLNYNPRRIPAALTEVKCSCQKPSAKIIGGHAMECQPLKYNVRVLVFNDECSSFTEHVETITFACIPIIKNGRDVKGDHDFMTEVNADAPQ